MSHNLLSYKEARIEALLQRNKELELENEKLTTYIFELCDSDRQRDNHLDQSEALLIFAALAGCVLFASVTVHLRGSQ